MPVPLLITFVFFLFGVLGHLAIWIAAYNRINATGLHRHAIKLGEKLIVAVCLALPLMIAWCEYDRWTELTTQSILEIFFQLHLPTKIYLSVALLALGLMTPRWVMDRPQFSQSSKSWSLAQTEKIHPLRVAPELRKTIITGQQFGWFSRLHGNEIASLERNIKLLKIPNLPSDLCGMKIAHISDVHLTGQLSVDFYRWAVDWLVEQKPHLVAISGDIVDYEQCLPLIRPVFDGLNAPHGLYFVLGNHDRRLPNPTDVCAHLVDLGWHDLGASSMRVQRGATHIRLIGNELPWFERARPEESPNADILETSAWTLGISHSPDQWAWGIQSKCRLLLCGHTHGGQIRLPCIGPLISPSWFGSRYASGVFLRESCVMYVSRGLSSVHPFRWRCLPEVTILKLTTSGAGTDLIV